MNLTEKFEKGKKTNTYTRIDSSYKVNVYLGYSDDGKMSMVITEPGKENKVKSSKLINVSLKRRQDNKMALSFDLLDESYRAMFLLFCKDIIVICESGGSSMAISNALARWKYWQEMFGRKKPSIMGKQEIKGLIGELLELKKHFIKDYGSEVAIKSWLGPLSGHKDFEIEDTWYEIKAVNESAVQVNISSLEQLDSEKDGHLIVIKLEETSNTNSNSINLNQAVISVTEEIADPEILDLFRDRLSNLGYIPSEEYDAYTFEYKGRRMYAVRDDFPRITRQMVPLPIGNVSYSILLDGINNFKE